MRKTFFILSLSFILMSCKSNLILISSIKETVLPGRPNIPSYSNYKVNFKTMNTSSIKIDRVEVKSKGTCYTCSYLLKEQKGTSYLNKISKQGNYILEIPLKDKYIISTSNCDNKEEELLIYYEENGKPNSLKISVFSEETKTMR
ncbi:hypothetical protein SAMN04489761_1822 [Tenacibaculum sp. MAR_2009_124]|uniref:hypothetical protein n=1 Tax=Tenacibaculum sp. MAR_2009_124 TaxID=1250059 RepID=UPI000894EB49|nr:hypothetical protein [Tenacibaculum sp. MAR_2009_124]SEB80531.1 hypothetical protein SAMN04489761_1822 [Tenacibaculum sp. MAR_2009_124]